MDPLAVCTLRRNADFGLWPHSTLPKGECPPCICDELQPRESSRLGGITEVLRRVCGVSRIPFRTVVTWLILPVVICLSQRLSHACLSINKFIL